MPELELSVSATTRAPRPGEARRRRLPLPLATRSSTRRVAAGEFVEHADYAGRRYGTLRSELERRTARGVPVVLEIEVQGARQVRETMPEAVQVFIAPPSREALRTRLVGRGTDDAEEVERAPARRRARARGAATSSPTSSSTTVSRTPSTSSRRSSRALDERPDAPRPQAARAGTLERMISPRIDTLLEHVDSNYASVLVAAKRARQINSYYHNLGEGTFDEFPPPMVESGSKNYLTIALEEVAAGKIKYHYR